LVAYIKGLRRIFGPKRDEVAGWRIERACLRQVNYNDEVNEDEMGRAFSTNGDKTNAYRLLVRKSEGKRPLGRLSLRWVDNIEMNLV
jgi:hypothetical protein